MEFRGRERMLLDIVRRMKDEINQLRRNVVEQISDEIREENSILKSEVVALRLQLDQASETVISSRNRGWFRMKFASFVIVLLLLNVLILSGFMSRKDSGKKSFALP
ncbi:hypothetical protein COLO4_37905 [Corchorus olitorius]|uniref:Uncharacterized protein n=1 Tax=Corchorus olitorius TaxID=93759 RepID=A0A1R3FY40_9ROSI|nr:hypothetical protein COLO4_37905 [Corchorus olitorius]